MKSIFLKLSSFRFGAARRHCPFRSIIHKLISLFLALIIFFLHVLLVPISVEASALPSGFQPYIRPVYNTSITDLQEAYSNLSGDELTIFLILAGAYVINYAGLGDFGLVFEDPPTDATLKERLEFTGQQLIDTLFLPQNLFNAIFDPILSYLQGCIVKASNTDINDFYADLGGGAGHSFGVLLPYDESLILSFNQFFALQSGLLKWSVKYYVPDFVYSYKANTLTGLNLSTYEGYVSSLENTFLANYTINSAYSGLVIGDKPYEYDNIFINTSDYKIYIVNDNGVPVSNTNYWMPAAYQYVNDPMFSQRFGNYNYLFSPVSYNPALYNSYKEVLDALFNNDIYFADKAFYFFFDWINDFYVGDSWSNREEVTSSLGITDSVDDVLEVPKAPTLLDLSAVIEALQGLSTSLADLRTVILENSYNNNTGAIVIQNDFDLNSLSQLIPESGIVVPEGLFGSSKGFIDYLWYMTKPLVQYTHDFLGTMWFDGVDGFDFSGPAPIVFGVITLGLIGGLIVKFLL